MKKLLAAGLSVCLLLCGGCTPKMVETPPPTPSVLIPDDPVVKTDWSKLAPYEEEKPICTRRYEDFTDTLIPADDYGPLVPFLGDKLGGVGGEGNRYGLATLDGEVVVDPVFSNVWRGDGSGWGYHSATTPVPYMMLAKGISTTSRDEWPEGGSWAMAALDGSWCTEFKYGMDGELTIWDRGINRNATEKGLFVLDGSALVYLDGATGREALRVEGLPVENLYDALFSARWDGSGAVYQYYDYDAQGTDNFRLVFRADAAGVRRLTGREAELAQMYYVDSKTVRTPDEGGAEVLDEAGEVLLRVENRLDYRADARGGVFVEYREDSDETIGWCMDILAVYAADTLERVENSPLVGRRMGNMLIGDMWYWCREEENVIFFRGDEVYTLAWPDDPSDFLWGRVALFQGEQGYSLVALDGTVLAQNKPYNDVVHLYDRVTGEPYIRLQEGRSLLFYDEDGKLLHTFAAAPSESGVLANGALLVTGADSSGLRNEAGEWVFRWVLPSGEWD